MQRFLYLSIFIFQFLFAFKSKGQVNLAINPSFEDIYGCPNYAGQIDSVIGWGTMLNGGGGDPDLHHVCCLTTNCGVPIGWNGRFQFPKTGLSFVGLKAYYSVPNQREYIQGRLVKMLEANSTYCISFYVNLDNISKYYCNTIGAYFDNGDVYASTIFGLAQANPQIYNISQLLIDTLDWIKIEGTFIAIGTEEYITIGNFFPDSLSDINIFNSTSSTPYAYYNIEDVSVIDANLLAYAGKDTLIHLGDSIFIGRQPEIGLDEDCIWFVNGLPIDTITGMWVKPDSSTTYVLEQTICGNVSWDTVRVVVSGVGIDSYAKDGKGIMLYPNPAFNTLNIESSTKFSQLIISDVLGNVVIKQQVYNHAVSVDVSGLGKGLYFVRVESEKGFVVRKFLKE